MNNSKKYQHRLQMRKDVMEIMVKPITNNGSIATTTVSQ